MVRGVFIFCLDKRVGFNQILVMSSVIHQERHLLFDLNLHLGWQGLHDAVASVVLDVAQDLGDHGPVLLCRAAGCHFKQELQRRQPCNRQGPHQLERGGHIR